MIRLSRIYTRGGDKGTTALADGRRVSKTHPLLQALGDVDETNACLGLAKACCRQSPQTADDQVKALEAVQHDLFDLGADLAVTGAESGSRLRITTGHISRLEKEIDVLNRTLEPLNSFLLPGSRMLTAHLHHARCVCRRAERSVVALERSSDLCQIYLNRLSDWLFVCARAADADPKLWEPGKNITT